MIRQLFLMSVLCGALCGVENSTFASDSTIIDPLEPTKKIVRHFYPESDINALLTGNTSQDEDLLKGKIKSAIQAAANDNTEFCNNILFHDVEDNQALITQNLTVITSMREIIAGLDFDQLNFMVKPLTYQDQYKAFNTFPALLFQYKDEDEATKRIDHEKGKTDKATGRPEQVSIEEYKRLTKLPPYMPTFNMSQQDLVKLMTLRSTMKGHTSQRNCAQQ